jgi:hypothetical protein
MQLFDANVWLYYSKNIQASPSYSYKNKRLYSKIDELFLERTIRIKISTFVTVFTWALRGQ